MNNTNIEQIRHESLKNLNKINNDLNRRKKFKIIVIIVIIIVSFILFKLTVKEIVFPKISSDSTSKNMHQLFINDTPISFTVESSEKSTIIPSMIYLGKYNLYNHYEGYTNTNFELNKNIQKINLDIKSYKCLNDKNKEINCNYNSSNKKEEINLDYKMVIRNSLKDDGILYNGDYISDISNYISEVGKNYRIEIHIKEKNKTTIILFDLHKKKELEDYISK